MCQDGRVPLLRTLVAVAALSTCTVDARGASGDERGESDAKDDSADPEGTEGKPGALPAAAAVFPGVLLHGSGSFAAGRERTAGKLLAVEGVGLGLVLLGGATLALTGANRHLVGPAAVVTITGVGLFATSFAADVYAATSGRDGTRTTSRRAPVVVSELGYRYVYDPQFPYRSFAYEGFSARLGRWRAEPSGWFSLGPPNQRLRLELGHRLLGPRPDALARDGSFVEVEVAATHHHFGAEALRATTAELSGEARLDLVRFDRVLRGSFAELAVGVARRLVDLGLPTGATLSEDVLLARFAWGVVLGGPGSPRGEVLLAYDHRHDDYAAGLLVPGLGSGVAGHFELDGTYWLDGAWGLRFVGQVGAALVGGASVVFRETGGAAR